MSVLGPERKAFSLNKKEYHGFLSVMDLAGLEAATGSATALDLLNRCNSVGGSFTIIKVACQRVAKRTDLEGLKADFEAQLSRAGLISVSNIAAELLQDTGMFKNGEDDEEKKA